MAYLRDIIRTCSHYGCTRRATVELYGSRNQLFDHYCPPHGNAALKRRQAEEDSYAETARTEATFQAIREQHGL
jgi:hypothetical protein